MSLKLLLARHGSSDAYEQIDSDEEIFRQTQSSPLSHLGQSQAHLLGRHVAIYRPEVLLTSPFTRARQTADILAKYSPLFSNVFPDLAEIRRVVDGQSIYSQINLDYKRWRGETIRKGDLQSKFHPQDESFGELFTRATRVKHWVIKEFDGQVVALSSHCQFDSMFLGSVLLGDKPNPHTLFNFFNRHFLSHAAYAFLTWNHRKGWQMKEKDFNITSHLG